MLTDTKIKKAKPKKTQYKLSDGERLNLLIHPNGSKYWQYTYSFGDREKVYSIGKYPLISLVEARVEKIKLQKLLLQNIDPNSEKRKRRLEAEYKDRNTFYAVAEDWRAKNRPNRTDRHDNRTWARLENHVFPYLGKMPVTQIQPVDILVVVEKIEKAGYTSTSHTVLAICSSVLQYAVITARLKINPAINLGGALQPHKQVHFATLKSRELPSFFEAFDLLQVCEIKKLAFLLLMHTGLRTRELRMGEWAEVDFQGRLWILGEERTKMRREHVVPLSRQAKALLERLHFLTGKGRWMFPNTHAVVTPYLHENVINDMIAAMGYKGHIVGHGFRSLFSTVLNEQGSFKEDAVERQLSHLDRNAVRRAYNRGEYFEERVEMMQWWSDFLDRQMVKPLPEKEAQVEKASLASQMTMTVGTVSGDFVF